MLLPHRRAIARLITIPAALCCVLVVASGCAAGSDARPMETYGEQAFPIFSGGPAEYHVLFKACMGREGIEVSDNPEGELAAYDIDLGSYSQEEITAASLACREELGVPQLQGLSDEQLRERYEARVVQWECLVAAGYVSGEPISQESFVEIYRRSGELQLWDPRAELTSEQRLALQSSDNTCVITTSW